MAEELPDAGPIVREGTVGAYSSIDLMHTPTSDDYTWSENTYFGFHIPEQRINGEIYVWLHTNLRVASSGVFIWRGMKKATLAAEYFDFRQFLPFPHTDLDDYELVNGLHVRVLETERKYQVGYVDESRRTEVHLLYEAIAPPMPYEGRSHFDQPMKTTGAVVLQGKEFRVDGFFTRDRSWGARSEVTQPGPPFTYVTGIFDERLAFHLTASDSAEASPEWSGVYTLPRGTNLVSGYVLDGGQVRRLRKAHKKTYRGPDGLRPRRIDLELADQEGNRYDIRGDVTAIMPWHPWPNLLCYMCQVRWDHAGRIGWGDIHEIMSNDFVHRFIR